MALLNFPTPGSIGEQTTQNGNTWQWNGTSWVAFNNLSLTSQVSGILAVQYGGTGFGGTFTKGDLLYASSSNTFTKLAAGTAGSVLASTGPGGDLYWKLDAQGAGTVGSGTANELTYYDTTTSVSSATGITLVAGTKLTIGLGTSSTSTTTGAFIVYGGVGIGGSLWTNSNNYSSISGVGFQNSAITSGVWSGTAISLSNGGTNGTRSGVGVSYELAVYNSTGMGITQIATSASIANSILLQSIELSYPTWVGQSQLVVGGASTAANIYAGSQYQIPYQSAANTTTFITNAAGSGASVLTQTTGSAPVYVPQSQLIVGTASSAGQWQNARTVTFSGGGVTGSFTIDGSANVSGVAITVTDNSIALGQKTTGQYASTIVTSGSGISATAASVDDGTAYTIYSSATNNNTASTIVFRDGSGNFSAGTITASLSGLATSATKVGITTSTSSSALPLTFSDVQQPFGALGSTPTISAIANTGAIVATTFIGNHAGAAITATNFYGTLSGLATSATKVGITTSTSSSAVPITFSDVQQPFGALGSTTTISAIANTGAIVATTFIGNLSGTAVTATHYGSGGNLTNIVTSATASNGINITGTGAITVGNTGVLSLTGTANQVLVAGGSGSATTGAITLTLPQNINTGAGITFANVTISDGAVSTVVNVGNQPTSMVNKQYVDNLASGLDIHGSVRAIQVSALTANYVQTQASGSAATGAYLISTTTTALPNIDTTVGFAATGASQRILVNGGFTGTASIAGTTPFTPASSFIGNGIYFVSSVGSGSSNWILTRAADTDDNVELTGGTFTFVEEGTNYADSGWVCSNDTTNLGAIQFGGTGVSFTQFTGGGQLSVGQGLSKVGNVIGVNANITSSGTNTAGRWSALAIGGAISGVAGTGFYPTFQIATGTAHAGTATLNLNADGFSLIGGTSSSRMLTVTGSGITLTGNGYTLTLSGDISLPSPTQHGVAYGSNSTTVAFLTAGGSGASVLTQTNGNAPVYLAQSQLVVGGASTAANIYAGSQYNLVYQINSNTTGFITNAAGSGASVLTQTTGSAPVYLAQSQLYVGSATSAAQVNTDAQTSTRYLIGTANNTASASAQLSTGSGVYIGNNILTSGGIAVTNNTGTAVTTGGALVVTGGVGIGGSLWTTASNFSSISGVGLQNGAVTSGVWSGTAISLSNGGTNGTRSGTAVSYELAVYNSTGMGITQIATSASIANSILLQSTELSYPVWVGQSQLFVGAATSAAQVNTEGTTSTRYLIGTANNTASTSAQLSTGSGITIGDNRLTSGSIAVTNNTGTAVTTGGALVVTGGVGIGGSLWTTTSNFSSISGVGHQNGVITSGIWSGTAISLSNGGTNGTASGTAVSYQLAVYNSTGSAITQVASGTASSILFQSNASTAPSWVGQSALYVGAATSAAQVNTDAQTSTRYLIGTANNTASSSAQLSTGSGITIGNNYLTSGAIAVTNNTGTAVTTGGALIVTGGVGIGGSLWTTTSNFSSISGVGHQNGVITSGVWSGTAISTSKGGTGLITVNANEVLIGASTGNTWTAIGSTYLPVVGIGSNPPTQPGGAIGATQAGQLWWDSQYGVLKIFYVDGTPTPPGQWVDATPVLGSSGGASSTKRSYVMTFGAGFTPSTGADTVQIQIPYAPDNTSKYYYIKRLDYRNETLSTGAGVSFYIERFTGGNASFNVSTGNRIHTAGAGAASSFVVSNSTYTTSYTLASTGASFVSSSGVAASVISGDYLRLNFSAINSAATLSVSMILEEQ